jgi:hypothetical protein
MKPLASRSNMSYLVISSSRHSDEITDPQSAQRTGAGGDVRRVFARDLSRGCDVLADGDRVGVTNHTILITANEYTITLSGDDYVPTSQDVVVAGTSIMRPLVVV